jgi:ribosomal protein L35AE/L33A
LYQTRQHEAVLLKSQGNVGIPLRLENKYPADFAMDAAIVNYRGGKRTRNNKQMVLRPPDTKNKAEAEKLVGKKVEWTTTAGNKLAGQITRSHGTKGAVVAAFEKGLPGQAIGTKVQIL